MWVCRLWRNKPWGWESRFEKFETKEEAEDCGEWYVNTEWNDGEKREYYVYNDEEE